MRITLARLAFGAAIPAVIFATAAGASASTSWVQPQPLRHVSGLETVSGTSTNMDVPVRLSGLVTVRWADVNVSSPDTTVWTHKGDITVQAGQGRTHGTVNPRDCAAVLHENGPLRAVSGTGAFAGARGRGFYGLTFTGFVPRNQWGRCAAVSAPQELRNLSVALTAKLWLTLGGHRHH
jgi:hypothetical protein